MPQTGKIDPAFFEAVVGSRLGADRLDVSLGPRAGVDFGVVDLGERALVLATDPLSILPSLGFGRAARFALRVVLADVAVSGFSPTHLSISFTLPPEMTDDEFETVWAAVDEECRDLGIAVTTGHTARYEGCQYPWIGGATALALGDPDDLIRPDGARPGDDILITKGPAVESVGLLTSLFPDAIDLPPATLDTCQSRLADTDAVRDALTVAAAGRAGISSMHDATEGGLLGALHEMAASAGVCLSIDAGAVPLLPGVRAACDALGMDPWRATTAGTLVITADPSVTDEVVAALEERGTRVGVAGTVESGSGVVLDGDRTEAPSQDASWPVYERLLDRRRQ